VECGIKRAFADLKHVAGNGTEAEADGPTVERLERENFQEQKIKSALNEVVGFAHIGIRGEYRTISLGKQGERVGLLGVSHGRLAVAFGTSGDA